MSDDRGVYPVSASSSQVGGPDGHSYGAVILPARDVALADLLHVLGGIRFTGWIAPPQEDWTVVLGDPGEGVVADDRRGVIEVAGLLAAQVPGPVLAIRVRQDRQLALVAWRAAEEVARYCSDASREPDADKDVLSEPVGAEYAGAFAQLWDRPDAVEELAELLEEELDPDSVYESERLGTTLRLLGLPGWIVSASSLPRAMPRGPAVADLTRLRAGLTGVGGRSRDALLRPVRRRQNPPPVIEDPPTGGGMGLEPWMF